MNPRRAFVALLATGWLRSPIAAEANVAAGPQRIGYLTAGLGPASGRFTEAERIFFDRMRELGWIPGDNLLIEIRRGEGRAERLPALVAELVQQRVDVIVTAGTTAVRAAREGTDTIPIVMAGAGDPVASGLVKSLARPGGNITGISLQGEEIVPKALSLLMEMAPQARRIDLLGNAANPANPFFARIMAEAGRAFGVETRVIEVHTPDELVPAIAGTRADALLVLADPMFYPNVRRIAAAGIQRRLPIATTGGPDFVKAGMLMSYSVHQPGLYRRAADYADRILRGARPADMPVEQPTRYSFALNPQTAKALGLTLPPSLLLRADEVIE